MTLTNSPGKGIVFRLEQRKSYSLLMSFSDGLGQKTNLTGCQVFFDFQKTLPRGVEPVLADTTRIPGEIDAPTSGQVRFDVQGSQLTMKAGVYPVTVTLITPTKYSLVVVKGEIDLQANTEFISANDFYPNGNPVPGIEVVLRGEQVINVTLGSIVPPNAGFLLDTDKAKLVAIPPGGSAGAVLAKKSGTNYDTQWSMVVGEQGPQGIQGIKGDEGAPGPQGVKGPKGDTGSTGAKGEPGASASAYEYNLVIGTQPPPGARNAMTNTSNAATATRLYLSYQVVGLDNIAPLLRNITDGDSIIIQNKVDETQYAEYTADNDAFDHPDQQYVEVPLTYVGGTVESGQQNQNVLIFHQMVGAKGDQGIQGPKGDKGDKGDTGSQGLQGVPGLTWKGQYSSITAYAVNDAVYYQSSAYVATKATTNIAPSNTSANWTLLALGVRWRFEWDVAATYSLNDMVSYVGASYINIYEGNKGNAPSGLGSYWRLVADRGPEGPPGAYGSVTKIPGAANLDSYKTFGLFHQDSQTDANSGFNYPFTSPGMLTVGSWTDGTNTWVYQDYQVNSPAYEKYYGIYRRQYIGTTWSKWFWIPNADNVRTINVDRINFPDDRYPNSLPFIDFDAVSMAFTGQAHTLDGAILGWAMNQSADIPVMSGLTEGQMYAGTLVEYAGVGVFNGNDFIKVVPASYPLNRSKFLGILQTGLSTVNDNRNALVTRRGFISPGGYWNNSLVPGGPIYLAPYGGGGTTLHLDGVLRDEAMSQPVGYCMDSFTSYVDFTNLDPALTELVDTTGSPVQGQVPMWNSAFSKFDFRSPGARSVGVGVTTTAVPVVTGTFDGELGVMPGAQSSLWVDKGAVAGTNLFTNPSFETGAPIPTGVTFTSNGDGVRSSGTDWVGNGQYSLKMYGKTTNDAWAYIQGGSTGAGNTNVLQPGKSYYIAAVMRLPQLLGSPGAAHLHAHSIMVRYNTVTGLTGATSVYSNQAPDVVGTHRLEMNVTIPANAVWAQVMLGHGAADTEGPTFWDQVQIIETTETKWRYFDGDTLGCTWSGTPHASTSVYAGPKWVAYDMPTPNTELGTAVDFNTLALPGYYHQPSDANAGNATNSPINKAGMLTVTARITGGAKFIYQEYQPYLTFGDHFYRRQNYNGTWGAWKEYQPMPGFGTFTGNYLINNRSTMADVPGLACNLGIGTWIVECVYDVQGPAAADVKFAAVISGAPTATKSCVGPVGGVTDATANSLLRTTAHNSTTAITYGTDGTATSSVIRETHKVVATVAGVFQIQAAQAVATVGDTSIIASGTFIMATKVA